MSPTRVAVDGRRIWQQRSWLVLDGQLTNRASSESAVAANNPKWEYGVALEQVDEQPLLAHPCEGRRAHMGCAQVLCDDHEPTLGQVIVPPVVRCAAAEAQNPDAQVALAAPHAAAEEGNAAQVRQIIDS